MVNFSDTTGIRRERERLGAGRWSGALIILILAGVPLMLGAHFKYFPDSTREKITEVYSSLDDIPELFDPITQEAQVRYCGDPEGTVEFVGKDVEWSPTTGERCWPLTPAVLKLIRDTEQEKQEARAVEEARKLAELEEARRLKEEEAAQTAARRAEEDFRNRYLRTSALAQLNDQHVAVAISDDGLERVVADALRQAGAVSSTNLFTDEVFDPSIFSTLSAGDERLLHRLGLKDRDGVLLLGRLLREPLSRTGVGNAANMRGQLSVYLVPLSGGSPVALPTLSEAGAGFNEEQARSKLYEHLTEALFEETAVRRLVD